MLRFRQYLNSRDEWLEEWNKLATEQGLGEEVEPIEITQKTLIPDIKNHADLKRYIKQAATDLNFPLNWDILKSSSQTSRYGNAGHTSDIFKNFLNKAFGSYKSNDITVLEPKDAKRGLKNPSGTYDGFTIELPNFKGVILLAGEQKRSTGTEYQELGFLFLLAARFNNSDGIDDEKLFNLSNWETYSINEGGTPLPSKKVSGVMDFVQSDPNWKKSLLLGTKIVKDYLGIEPKEYHKDSSDFSLNVKAKTLYKKSGYSVNWNNDKWNPADVWFVYDTSDRDFQDLEELNSFLKGSLKKGACSGVVGLSLKKLNKSTAFKEVNMGIEPWKVKSWSFKFCKLFTQGVSQIFDLESYDGSKDSRHEITYRLFQNKANLMLGGEVTVKGTDASHGKVFLSYIDDVAGTTMVTKTVRKMIGGDNIEYDKNTDSYKLSRIGRTRFTFARAMYGWLKRSINDVVSFDSSGLGSLIQGEVKVLTKLKPTFFDQYGVFDDIDKFESTMNDYIFNGLKGSSVSQIIAKMDVKISATFQIMAFTGWWVKLHNNAKGKYNKTIDIAKKMLYFGMSMSDFSAAHIKIGG
jgi:hypothetical protein